MGAQIYVSGCSSLIYRTTLYEKETQDLAFNNKKTPIKQVSVGYYYNMFSTEQSMYTTVIRRQPTHGKQT